MQDAWQEAQRGGFDRAAIAQSAARIISSGPKK
jgi:hypothetical protein